MVRHSILDDEVGSWEHLLIGYRCFNIRVENSGAKKRGVKQQYQFKVTSSSPVFHVVTAAQAWIVLGSMKIYER